MKIYAIKDRMLDYYMQFFMGEADKPTMAAVADTINREDSQHAIAKTPHFFELWRVGDIDQETGEVKPDRELVADCASLVRPRFRESATPRDETLHQATGGQQRPPRPAPYGAYADAGAAQEAAQAAHSEGGKAPPRTPGGTGKLD